MNSGYDKNDKDYEIKINNLKISLEKLNNSKKIIDWVEPVFITDMQEIIAKKWDHVGGELSRKKKRGILYSTWILQEDATLFIELYKWV
ncbi:hypothetical protein [Mycoplasmopsis caviae]|uniref:hypothetical protein n=1 Tax=Mycoplasmopsis caviae TaxID=55603 RepID=UPI000F7E6A4A|nr:hypothetical protein [Mycoplasmopsis caviae]